MSLRKAKENLADHRRNYLEIVFEFWLYALATHFHSPSIFSSSSTSVKSMVCYTFLESYDFTGKRIIPFCTNEGSGMGSSARFIKKLCPGATVEDGTPIHGAEAAYADSEAREIAALAK